MADTTIKKWNPTLNNNNGGWEEVYPETTVGQIQASGTRSSTTFLRGDGVWAVPSGVDNYVNITGDTMTGNLINQGYIEVEDPNDSDYARYNHYGVEFNRSASYLRPTTNGTYNLNIGQSTKQWDTIDLRADNRVIIPAGNVGIGTTNPAAKLTVDGESNSKAIELKRTGVLTGNAALRLVGIDTEEALGIQVNDSEKVRIDYNGKVGIGTTSPGEKLEVNGKIKVNNEVIATKFVDYNNGNYYVDPASQSVLKNVNVQRLEVEGAIFNVGSDSLVMPMVKGGHYNNDTSSVTGAIYITLPSGTYANATMMNFFVDVFDYAGGSDGESFTLHIGGYIYTDGTWHNTFSNLVSGRTDRFFTVRFNYDSTNNYNIIYIGETTSTWSYPKVTVRDFSAGYSGADDADWYNNSFSVGISSSFLGTTYRSKNAENVASYALDADKLDGQHGSYYAPKASPALTGTPTAPTAAANTNTTQIATTAYVQQEITDLIGGAPGALDTLNELAAAINDDASYASTITTALAGKVAKSGDTMTDTLTISAAKTTDDPLLKLVSTATGDGDAVIELEANDTGEAGIIFKNPDNTNAQGWFLGYGDAFSEHFYLYDRQNGGTKLVVGHDGDVGIGTTSPKGKLQIHQDTLDTAALFISRYNNEDYALFQVGEVDNFGGAGSYGGSVVNASNRTLVLSTQDLTGSTIASANRPDLAIISSGYVGIGTSSPTEKLTVYGDSNISENSPVTYIKHNFTGTHGFGLSVSRDNSDVAALALGSNSSNHGIVVANNTDLVLSTISSGAINSGMTVKTSGNVGIGTTSPSEKLQVDGNIKLNSTLPKIQFTDTNNDSDFHIANNNGVLEIADTTNQLERMKIDSSGNVTLPASGGLTLVDKALTNSSGALLWDGDEIYHEGHKPTYTELGTMAYSNLTGTPTIPTNNNQLTNGAGYTTNTGTVTSVATGGGLTGGTITGSGTISHADTSTQASVNNSGNTFIQDITLDTYGHITAITSATASSSGGNTWTEIKTGSTTISSGTTVTNVTLSSAIDDTSVIAFELNTASVTSYTSQVFIVKIENSSSTNGGILYNQYAASTLIRTGSLRVYRGINSTTLSFSNVYYYSNGSSAETADTVYVGKIWKLGVTGA